MADEVAWDDDDFDPDVPAKTVVTDKWQGEDEEDDVKDNWDDDDAEKEDENENKATQVKKKKSLKERIAEKEEKRKKEIEEKRRKEEELKKQLKPMTPSERAMEKQRIQREQEEADLVLAMEAFGSDPSTGDKSIDQMNPSSREEFEALEVLLKDKLTKYEKSPHYVYFIDTLIRDLTIGLEPEDLKKMGSALNALSNEKTKQQKGKVKKKSSKAKIMAVREGDFANDFADDLGGEYDDFI